MKCLFAAADEYLHKSSWKDLALIKFCLCAIGVLWGASLPAKAKKPAIFAAMAVFIATYIPLMTKFLKILTSKKTA